MARRDLTIGITGNSRGFERAVEEAEAKARGLDRELVRLERQQAAQEKVTASTAAAVRKYGEDMTGASLAARKLGTEAERAAQKAERAQVRAAAAAEAASRGILEEAKAARIAAQADQDLERAALKAAAAQRAAARAANEQAQQERQLARDAALTAAAQRLAMLRATGQAHEYNATLDRLKVAHGDLSSTAVGAFEKIDTGFQAAEQGIASGLSELSGLGRALPSAIIVGLQLLPAAASAAGAGITLGLGGALSLLAIKAQASSADVQMAFSGLKTHMMSEFRQWTAPFHATLLSVAQDAEHAFDAAGPAVKAFSAEAAPAISRFAHSASASMSSLNPAVTSLGTAFARTLDSLGGEMPTIMNNVATSVKAITDAVAANPEALTRMATGITYLARGVGDSIGFLIRYEQELETVFRIANAIAAGPLGMVADGFFRVKEAVGMADHSMGSVAVQTFPSFAQQAIASAAATGQLMTAQQAAALTAEQLKTAMDSLTGKTLTEREAMVAYRQSITAMTKSLKDNGAAHGFATAKGAANEQALDQMALAAQRAAQGMKANGRSAQDVSAFLESARKRIIAAAEGMHYSAAAARNLADKLLGIKAPPPVKLTMDDADFLTKLHAAQGLKLNPKTGLLKGNNSDYFNKWLQAKGLKIDPKTGRFRGNNADYYNKWLQANGLHIDTKTGRIVGNTAAFWSSVNSIPQVVGHRQINVSYVPTNSANEPGTTRHADGGIDRYADGGVRRDLDPFIAAQPTVLFGETSTGGEAFIPLGENKRDRSVALLGQVAQMFGMAVTPTAASGLPSVLPGSSGPSTVTARPAPVTAPIPSPSSTSLSTTDLNLGDILSRWQDTVKPASQADLNKAIKDRRTQVDQLKNAEDALARARKRHDPRAIAAAERRVRKERDDLREATKKLHDVEERRKFAKMTPAQQLGAALGMNIKNNATFIKNLQTLADRGFGALAQQLLAMGGPDAEKIAASAVKLSNAKLNKLQGQLKQSQQQQDYLANLPNILNIRSALKNTKGGISTWTALLNATGLDPASLAAAVKLMAGDLGKTASGKALLADMHAHGYQRGGEIVGPPGVDRVPLWGTAGEYVINKRQATAHRPLLDAINSGAVRVPVASMPVRGGDGARAGASIHQTFATQEMNVHQLAREAAREAAWQLRG